MNSALGRRLALRWTLALLIALLTLVFFPVFDAADSAAETSSYRLAPGDRVAVTVFGQPDLSGEAVVGQDGNLRLPIVGDVPADALTLGELEAKIGAALKRGYLRNAAVSVRIVDFRPVYVLGLVRTPGSYPYRQGLSALSAIALAGGIGAAEERRGALVAELLQAEERVRQFELGRAALIVRRARLAAEQSNDDKLIFPDLPESVDPDRLAQFIKAERLAFATEQRAEREETEALQRQIPTFEAEIDSLKQQQKLEQQQRDLNHEMVVQYERMLASGLARKPNYIEVRREEARIDSNIERLRSEVLRAEQMIGNLKFRIGELSNSYRRRATTALQEIDRSLLELSVSLPAAQRMRAARTLQIGTLTASEASKPTLSVIRGKSNMPVAFDAAGDFALEPGDIVQVGALLPASADLTPTQIDSEGRVAARQATAPQSAIRPAPASN
jgi:polysaccharide export outer membrane protein